MEDEKKVVNLDFAMPDDIDSQSIVVKAMYATAHNAKSGFKEVIDGIAEIDIKGDGVHIVDFTVPSRLKDYQIASVSANISVTGLHWDKRGGNTIQYQISNYQVMPLPRAVRIKAWIEIHDDNLLIRQLSFHISIL